MLALPLVLLVLLVTRMQSGRGGETDGHGLVPLTLPALPLPPGESVVVGLSTIWLHAMATSGFRSEAAEPGISPPLPGFLSSRYLGLFPPFLTNCPSLLWVPELLCLQSDIRGSHRPWLLGPTLPLLVRTKDLERSKRRRLGPSASFLSLLTFFFFNLLDLGQCFWEWASLQWKPYLH